MTKPTCAFCGWRDAVAWAPREGRAYRICAKCNTPHEPVARRPVNAVDTVRSAIADLTEITVRALGEGLPHMRRSTLSMTLQSFVATGELVVLRKVGSAHVYGHAEGT